MTKTQQRVLSAIRNAWPRAVRKRMFDLTPRTVDSTVRELRLAGFPIASDPDGYTWATTPRELRDTADGLLRRMSHVAQTRDALEATAAAMELRGLGAETPGLWDQP